MVERRCTWAVMVDMKVDKVPDVKSVALRMKRRKREGEQIGAGDLAHHVRLRKASVASEGDAEFDG